MGESMQIRRYRTEDAAETAALFYETVHTVNAADYTPEQLDAWAPRDRDLDGWNASLAANYAVVAVRDGAVVGFGDMSEAGYLDRLYVRAGHTGQGIGTAVCACLEDAVRGDIVTHASVTARPFFEKRGYVAVRDQQVERRGVLLTNFVMKKERPHGTKNTTR